MSRNLGLKAKIINLLGILYFFGGKCACEKLLAKNLWRKNYKYEVFLRLLYVYSSLFTFFRKMEEGVCGRNQSSTDEEGKITKAKICALT